MQGTVSARPAENKPKLLDQVRNVIRVKHYSNRTEQAYIDWIKRFILFHGKRHPTEMAEEEVSEVDGPARASPSQRQPYSS